MSKHDKIKTLVLSGASNANIRFDDLCSLLRHAGFKERINGSHHIFYIDGIEDIINLQPDKNGKAKPYQVRQSAKILKRTNPQ